MAEIVAVYRAQGESFSFLGSLRRLARHREILLTFAVRDLKIRYKQTLLGVLWAVIPPFMLMVVFSIIFSRFARMPSEGLPYPVFVYSALLPWTFFSSSIVAAANSLTHNFGIISKVYFPREILPWAAIAATGADFLVSFAIFGGIIAFYRTPVTPYAFLVLPLLAIQIVFAAGIGLLAAALNVTYRDVRYALPLVLQLWMYATPIVYPASVVPARADVFYYLVNPMAGLVDGYRRVLARGLPLDPVLTLLSAASAFLVFFLCYRIFKHMERELVDAM